MIDVIGTDAGAPASLPAAQQALIRAAEQIAAPRRLQPALETWLESPVPLIDSDDPRHLVEVLSALSAIGRGWILAVILLAVAVAVAAEPRWFPVFERVSGKLKIVTAFQ